MARQAGRASVTLFTHVSWKMLIIYIVYPITDINFAGVLGNMKKHCFDS